MAMVHDAVIGTSPGYDMIDELTKRKLGHWTGGFVDDWTWNGSAVRKLSEAEATELYNRLKS